MCRKHSIRHWIIPLLLLFTVFSEDLIAQSYPNEQRRGPYTMYEHIIYPAKQTRLLSHIADDMAEGRSTGSNGNRMIASFIRDEFKKYGLVPFMNGTYFQRFEVDSVTGGMNVVGMIPSIIPSNRYVIVCAHFDHLGILNGNIYNGADDNASGVTAMLNIADMFGTMKKTKTGPDKNIIFVALDAKEHNFAGSDFFVRNLDIPASQIECAINIERIGTILEPVHDNDTSFVIVLGEKTLRKKDRGKIAMSNTLYNLGLDIDFTFYGSDKFTDLYYRLSDQIVFHKAGIPSLLFTSGFHKHTYKVTDKPDIISYPVLKQRSLLIFYFIMHI